MNIKKWNSFINENNNEENLREYVLKMSDFTDDKGGDGSNLLRCGLKDVATYIKYNSFYSERTLNKFKELIDAMSQDDIENNNKMG